MTNWWIEMGLVLIAIGAVNLVLISLILTFFEVERMEQEWDDTLDELQRFKQDFGSQ